MYRLRVLLTHSERIGNYGEFLLNSRARYVGSATSAFFMHFLLAQDLGTPSALSKYQTQDLYLYLCVNTALLPQYVSEVHTMAKVQYLHKSTNRAYTKISVNTALLPQYVP